MGINVNMDYSTLFSSLNGKASTDYVSGLAGLVSDMNSIQNGSYSKLVGAYYEKLEKEGRTTKNSSDDDGKVSERLSNTRLYNTVKSEAGALSDSAEALYSSGSDSIFQKKLTTTGEGDDKQTGYAYDESKIISAAQNFVKNYNSLIKDGASASDSTTSSRISDLSRITSSFADKLSKIGISVDDEKGTLSINTDKMKSAGMDAVKSVLGNRNGYAHQVASTADRIETAAKSAVNSKSIYNAGASASTAGTNGSLLDSLI